MMDNMTYLLYTAEAFGTRLHEDAMDTIEGATIMSTSDMTSQESNGSVIPTQKRNYRCNAKTRLALPRNPAKHYAETIVTALNSYDPNVLGQNLQKLCAKNARLIKRVYGYRSLDYMTEGVEYDHDWLQETVFPSIQAFCEHFTAWNLFVPDGVFAASGHRIVIDSPPTFVFISFLTFTGQSLGNKTINLVTIPFHEYSYSFHESVITNEVIHHGFGTLSNQSIQGSLAVHVNIHGLIEEIEIFFRE